MNNKVRILNNNKKNNCYLCGKEIINYKIRVSSKHYHLKCYYTFCVNNIETLKNSISYYRKIVRRLRKYKNKKQMLIESLQ